MKRTLAVTFLVLSLASAALADGGFPPPASVTAPATGVVQLADGGFPPPSGATAALFTGRIA
jgi:hypothetical protein